MFNCNLVFVLCFLQVTQSVSNHGPGSGAGRDRRHHPRGPKPSGSKLGLEILQGQVGRPERSVRHPDGPPSAFDSFRTKPVEHAVSVFVQVR